MKKLKKKKITMKDIADSVNVSINTVSLVLNNKSGISKETRQEIIKKAKEMGYTIPPQTHSRKNIALLLSKRYMKNLSFYSRVVYGITNCANQNSYNIIIDFFDNDSPCLPQSIVNNNLDGILTAGKVSENFLHSLNETNLPIVLIDYTSFNISTDSVVTQNLQGGYSATQYIIDKGHRSIGFVGDINYSNNLRERWLGFCCCIKDNDHSHVYKNHEDYSILGSIASTVIDKNYDTLIKAIKSLPELPTAWVCCNDETAVCMYQALNTLGIKPGIDISIIGFDDIENSLLVQPKLTTMHVPKKLMGETALLRLISRIENPVLPLQYFTLPAYLVERESVKSIIM